MLVKQGKINAKVCLDHWIFAFDWAFKMGWDALKRKAILGRVGVGENTGPLREVEDSPQWRVRLEPDLGDYGNCA